MDADGLCSPCPADQCCDQHPQSNSAWVAQPHSVCSGNVSVATISDAGSWETCPSGCVCLPGFFGTDGRNCTTCPDGHFCPGNGSKIECTRCDLQSGQHPVTYCTATENTVCTDTCTSSEDVFSSKLKHRISSGGDHTCVIMENGALKCWGANTENKLGIVNPHDDEHIGDENPEEVYENLPYVVLHPSDDFEPTVKSVSVGFQHTCAILNHENTLKCWGSNIYGELGISSTEQQPGPVETLPIVDLGVDSYGQRLYATQVVAGHYFTCALLQTGQVKCWGKNTEKQLGISSENDSVNMLNAPTAVVDFPLREAATEIMLHENAACALLHSGSVHCWGRDLGPSDSGKNIVINYETFLANLQDSNQRLSVKYRKLVAMDKDLLCVLLFYADRASLPICYGSSNYESYNTSSFSNVKAGLDFACGLSFDGRVQCFGNNLKGQLGTGNTQNVLKGPLHASYVAGASLYTWDVLEIAVGHAFACALEQTGKVFCWGDNTKAQLATGVIYSPNFVSAPTESLILHPGHLAWHAIYDCQSCLSCPNTHIVQAPCGTNRDTQCSVCPEGQFANYDNTECVSCPVGHDCASGIITKCPAGTHSLPSLGYCISDFCTLSSFYCPGNAIQETCLVCPDNGYQETRACNATHNAQCTICPENSFCSSPWTKSDCPVNSFAPVGSSHIENCTCAAGYRQCNSTKHSCVLCESASYCPGNDVAVTCPDVHHNSNPGAQDVGECFCNAGFFQESGTTVCTPCTENHYCPSNTTIPIPCPTNAVTTGTGMRQESDCACDGGHYSMEHPPRSCILCPVDMYCPGGNLTLDCPSNTSTFEQNGMETIDACTALPGFYITNTSTMESTPCPSNFWCTGQMNEPKLCPANSSSPPLSETVQDCVCDPLFYGVCVDHCDGMCDPCPLNHYCTGGSTATPCPDHSLVDAGLGQIKQDCVCEPGKSGPAGGPCEICAENSWCPGGINEQYACSVGAKSAAGSTAPIDCYCTAGYYGDAGLTCHSCSFGYYCPGAKTSGENAHQIPCPDNAITVSFIPEQIDINACICREGYFSHDAISQDGDHTCTPCTEDYFCTGDEIRNACPDHASSPALSKQPQDCVCDPGYEGENGANCNACPENYYCSGGNSKISCVANAIATSFSDAPSDCQCLPGFYGSQTDGQCLECLASSYCPGGQTDSMAIACPDFSSSVPGSHHITNCSCLPSYYGENGDTCHVCPLNHYCPGGTDAIPCPDHTDSLAASNEITQCLCIPGYDGEPGGPCRECNEDEICLGGSGGAIRCPANSLPADNASSVLDCECFEGYYGENGQPCTLCDMDFYCSLGNVITACPGNAGTLEMGGDDVLDCFCKAGHYGPQGGSCSPCEPNAYCPGLVVNGKTLCPDHSESPPLSDSFDDCTCVPGYVGATADSCALCPQGSFCRGDQDLQPCPENSNTESAGAAVATQCTCNSAYYGASGSQCLQCPVNTYCLGGETFSSCPPNSNAPVGSDDINDCLCQPGFYRENTDSAFVCSSCPVDQYCIGNTIDLPMDCPGNTTSLSQSSSESDCLCKPEFYSANGNAPCKTCEPGFFCAGGSSITSCPDNSFSSGNAQDESACICNAGYFGNNAENCEICPSGFYCSGGAEKQECPVHSYSGSNAQSLSQCVCNAGYFGTLGNCMPCSMGKYCTGGPMESTCPLNSKTQSAGKDAIYDCQCNAGYTGNASLEGCQICPENHFCLGDTHQEACPPHADSPAGSIFQTQCVCQTSYFGPNGQICQLCYPNAYCTGGTEIQECHENSYSESGSSSIHDCICNQGYRKVSNNECLRCRANYFCPDSKTPNEVFCGNHQNSPVGSFSPLNCTCNTGFYAKFHDIMDPTNYTCLECPTGMYCPVPGNQEQPHKVACPVNATSFPKSTQKTDCYCPPGFLGSHGEPCQECPAGQICTGTGNGTTQCPPNSNVGTGATSLDDCQCNAGFYGIAVHGCTPCPPNSYCLGGETFTSCPADTQVSTLQSTSENDCTCAPGFVNTTHGNAPCAPCSVGMFCLGGTHEENCPENSISEEKSTRPEDCSCAPEYFGPTQGPCEPCPVGSYCPGGLTISTCPENSIAPPLSTDISECTCKPQYYGANADNCQSCPRSAYCQGGKEATPCPENTHTFVTKSSDISQCLCIPSMYNTEPVSLGNAPSCNPCLANYYCESSILQACPENTHAPALASSIAECICNAGYYKDDIMHPCKLCDAGYYCPGQNNTKYACSIPNSKSIGATSDEECNCPNGKYKDFAISNACIPCPQGFYCQVDQKIPCPANASSFGNATHFTDCYCLPGSYKSTSGLTIDHFCLPCPSGQYCDGTPSTRKTCSNLLECTAANEYRRECSKTHDFECVQCTNIPENSVVIDKFNQDCYWECAENYYYHQENNETHPNNHKSGTCVLCNQNQNCPIGFHREKCKQASKLDAECVACELPRNSVPIMHMPGSESTCPFQCKLGYWRTKIANQDICCSKYSYQLNTQSPCICLPGWIGDGFDCWL